MENSRIRKEAKDVFRAKMAQRQELAQLPIEKKISILVHLQKTANEIRATVGRVRRCPWKI